VPDAPVPATAVPTSKVIGPVLVITVTIAVIADQPACMDPATVNVHASQAMPIDPANTSGAFDAV
jgi:hypothetical protein